MKRWWVGVPLGLTVAALALAVSFPSVFGADDSSRKTPAERAEARVKDLTTPLALTAEQAAALLPIFTEYYEKSAALRGGGGEKSAGDREQQRQAREQLKQELETKLAAVLSPAQMEQYKQFVEKQRSDLRKKWSNRHGEGEGEQQSGGEGGER